MPVKLQRAKPTAGQQHPTASSLCVRATYLPTTPNPPRKASSSTARLPTVLRNSSQMGTSLKIRLAPRAARHSGAPEPPWLRSAGRLRLWGWSQSATAPMGKGKEALQIFQDSHQNGKAHGLRALVSEAYQTRRHGEEAAHLRAEVPSASSRGDVLQPQGSGLSGDKAQWCLAYFCPHHNAATLLCQRDVYVLSPRGLRRLLQPSQTKHKPQSRGCFWLFGLLPVLGANPRNPHP